MKLKMGAKMAKMPARRMDKTRTNEESVLNWMPSHSGTFLSASIARRGGRWCWRRAGTGGVGVEYILLTLGTP